MGERAQRACEADDKKLFEALPWRERWKARLPGLLPFAFMVEVAVAFVAAPFFVD